MIFFTKISFGQLEVALGPYYQFSAEATQLMGFDKKIFGKISEVVTNSGGVGLFLRLNSDSEFKAACKSSRCSSTTMALVLWHIYRRSIPFCKFFEMISAAQIRDGIQSIDLPGIPASTRSISKCFVALADADFIFKFVPKNGVAQFIGINWERILGVVYSGSDHPQSLDYVLNELSTRRALFSILMTTPYPDIPDALRTANNATEMPSEATSAIDEGDDMKLTEVESKTKLDMREELMAKLRRRLKGVTEISSSPSLALDYWNMRVLESGRWGAILASSTAKERGMMKEFVGSLLRTFESDKAVRQVIDEIIEYWPEIAGLPFDYVCVSKEGNAFEKRCTVPKVPRFLLFYPYRHEIYAMIQEVKAGEVPDSSGEEYTGPTLVYSTAAKKGSQREVSSDHCTDLYSIDDGVSR